MPENTRDFTSRGLDRPEISENILNLALSFLIPEAQAAPFDYNSRKVTSDNFESIKQAYNRDGGKITEEAGGKVWDNFSKYYDQPESLKDDRWKNTCAIRLSHAMNGGGNTIPKPNDLPANIRVLSSENGGNFIFGAQNFNRYMENTNGTPTPVDKDLVNIEGKKGVIYFDNFHIDLWDGSRLHGNNAQGTPGSVAKDYIERGHQAFFWEAD